MSSLSESPYPEDHPFSAYLRNLRSTGSVSWFSPSASVNELRDYVWGLMNLRPDNTRHSEEGFAQTSAGTVLFTAVTNPRGSVLTCFPMNNIGIERINNAISDEWDRTREELSRGAYVGNIADAKHTAVDRGRIHPDFEGSNLFEFINGGTVERLDG